MNGLQPVNPVGALSFMGSVREIILSDLAATKRLGRRLGERLFPGSRIALVGPLGSGKTYLARAIASGLDVPKETLVTSPTFVLIQEYQGRLPIYHFDAYRLANESQFMDLGAWEYLTGSGVCLIEWADRVEACLPADYLRIELSVVAETSRKARLEATGPMHAGLLNSLPEDS